MLVDLIYLNLMDKQQKLQVEPTGRLRGWRHLLASSAIWGLFPLVSALGNGGESPFMFMAAWGLGGAVSSLIYVAYWSNKNEISWKYVFENFMPSKKEFFSKLGMPDNGSSPGITQRWNWLIIASIPRALTLAFFAWSTVFLPEAVSAILYALWTLFYSLLLQRLFQEKEEGQFKSNLRTIGLFIFIFIGAGLVILSPLSFEKFVSSSVYDTLIGIFLIALSIGFIVQGAFVFKWADIATCKWSLDNSIMIANVTSAEKEKQLNMMKTGFFLFESIFSMMAGSILGIILASSAGNFMRYQDFLLIMGFGAVIELFGTLTNASGTFLCAKNLAMQAIRYTTPVFSVLYLLVASQVGSMRGDIFVMGLAAIVVGNILVNFKAEDRFGIASLVVALWVSGVIVVYRDSFLEDLFSASGWFLDSDKYFAILALSATVFTLLLAFRINRISNRTLEEEKVVFSLLARLDRIEYFYDIKLQDKLKQIDSPKGPDILKSQYTEIRHKIDGLIRNTRASGSQIDYLLDTQRELDTLVHSKQYGREFGEPTAVVFLGMLTFVITLLTRPSGEGLAGIIFDSFGFIFAGTIAFLTVHIFDLYQERNISNLKEDKGINKFIIEFRKEGLTQEWWLAILGALGVLVITCVLIWQKWM